MRNIWELIATGKKDIMFIQEESFSPYNEFSSVRDIPTDADGTRMIYINGFYRFAKIMEPMFANQDITEEQRDWLFNLYMHYLTEFELHQGLTREELECEALIKALADGDYGNEVANSFKRLLSDEQYIIARGLLCQDKTKESVHLFADILVKVLKTGVVYRNKINTDEMLYYINRNNNQEDELIIKMIKELFLPVGFTLDVFWKQHFAVLGSDRTAILGEIELL